MTPWTSSPTISGAKTIDLAGSPWADDGALPHLDDPLVCIRLEVQRLSGFDHMAARTDDRHRLVGEADAALDRVGEVDLTGVPIHDADIDDLGVEDLLDLVADDLVHRLHVQPLGETALDLVDDRQLGGPFVGLREQTLRLVEESGVLERHAQACGDRREQLDVRITEGRLSVEVLQGDHPARDIADKEWHPDGRLRPLRALLDVPFDAVFGGESLLIPIDPDRALALPSPIRGSSP